MILFGGVQNPEAGCWMLDRASSSLIHRPQRQCLKRSLEYREERGLNRRQKINVNLEAGREVGSWMLEI